MTIERAIEVFGRGFSFTRCFTYPYEFIRVGPLWMMRDAPHRDDARSEEFIAYDVPPSVAIETIHLYSRGRHKLCVIHDMEADEKAVKESFKAVRYSLYSREPMFVMRSASAHPVSSPFRLGRVTTTEEANLVNDAARARQILPKHLRDADSALRLFAAWDRDTPIGWVRSIKTHDDASWVSNMFVTPAYRRRGLGRALMSTMLQDDVSRGLTWSVLLASNAGSRLYPTLGYQQIALLQLMFPAKPIRPAGV